jgi:hypothetical protein
MQLFALESAVLRCQKIKASASAHKSKLLDAVVCVCAFDASEKLATAARRAVNFIDDDKSCAAIHKVLGSFCYYETNDLLKAKRSLAEATSENEGYIF